MLRTTGERSRGGRSSRADWAGRIRRPSTPDPLVQEALVLVVQAGHSRLADEAGHVDEAGTVLGHHDGAAHDVEAPAQASSQHKTACGHTARSATLWSTRKASSKLAMSSSSNAAVGETAARRTVERRSSHIRHGGRERRDRYLPRPSRRVGEVFFQGVRVRVRVRVRG